VYRSRSGRIALLLPSRFRHRRACGHPCDRHRRDRGTPQFRRNRIRLNVAAPALHQTCNGRLFRKQSLKTEQSKTAGAIEFSSKLQPNVSELFVICPSGRRLFFDRLTWPIMMRCSDEASINLSCLRGTE